MRAAGGRRFCRPVVVVSRCLGLEACRWDGQKLDDDLVGQLARHVTLRPVCPEIAIGLGVPRAPVRLVERHGEVRMLQTGSQRDLTRAMARFRRRYLDDAGEVDGFVLKSRSPSCGVRDTKIHGANDGEGLLRRGAGLFAAAVRQRFPAVAVEDEVRLCDDMRRHHFLTRVFTRAAYREEVVASGTLEALVDFHQRNELLLRCWNQGRSRRMQRLLAGLPAAARGVGREGGGRSTRAILAAYREHLDAALSRAPRRPRHVQTAERTFDAIAGRLSPADRRLFARRLKRTREGSLSPGALLLPLRAWLLGLGAESLARQTWLEPYPAALLAGAET